jgi:tetratricopeptide (TPR) repeat protein
MGPDDTCQSGYALVREGDRFFQGRDLARARQCWVEAAHLLLPIIDRSTAPLPALCYRSAAVSQWRLALLAEQLRDPRAAATLYRKALEIDERHLPASADTAYFARSAGRNYLAIGDHESALGFARRAADLRRAVEPGTIGVSRDLNDLGRAHLARGEFDAALAVFTEALTIITGLEPGGDDEAATLNNLGQAHWRRGDPRTGLEYHLRALRIDENLDPRSPETATDLNNVGLMYKMLNDLPEAMAHYKRAFEIDHGRDPESMATARDLQNIAKLHAAYAEVFAHHGHEGAAVARAAELDFIRQALRIAERRAPGSPEHARILRAMGDAVSAQGNEPAAADFYRRADRIAPEPG